jgi:protein TonB
MKRLRITIFLTFVVPALFLMWSIAPAGQEKAEVDTMPIKKTTVDVVYPEKARKDGTEGTVWVKALVDEQGMVAKTEVIKSDAPVLEQAALDAARGWTFTPAKKDNKPVSVWVTIPFKFKLAEKKEKN